jgi:phosphatidylethanolamine/phosphatidyl-N-methylethanolamine N-methyltransferase
MTAFKAPFSLGDLHAKRQKGRAPRKRLVLIDEADREAALFFVRWLKAPHLIGAVTPSSRRLARAMAREVRSTGTGPIIELGGGTGSVTRALLESGIDPKRLIVVERDEHLHSLLKERFPALTVLRGDARQLRALVAPLGITNAAAIVSSLPLVTIPRRERKRIVAESLALLGAHAPFVQFTYGLTSPLAHPKYGVSGRIVARIWRNLPPASVWRFEPRREAHAARVA